MHPGVHPVNSIKVKHYSQKTPSLFGTVFFYVQKGGEPNRKTFPAKLLFSLGLWV